MNGCFSRGCDGGSGSGGHVAVRRNDGPTLVGPGTAPNPAPPHGLQITKSTNLYLTDTIGNIPHLSRPFPLDRSGLAAECRHLIQQYRYKVLAIHSPGPCSAYYHQRYCHSQITNTPTESFATSASALVRYRPRLGAALVACHDMSLHGPHFASVSNWHPAAARTTHTHTHTHTHTTIHTYLGRLSI
ncbi:hypothetical protein LY76DRAFT_203338 [Colletotrichum caudatum]|nr:hypothetical protein LY76DRAFT_203338 [Colletotrichum caudatum]